MKQLSILFLFLFSLLSFAQINQPTKWSTAVEKIGEDEYNLITNVTIDPGWHVYSQTSAEDMGPSATEFAFFDAEGNYELVGINKETGTYSEFTDVWGFDVYQFADFAQFEQQVKILNPNLDYIVVEAYFQVCDDMQCLAPRPENLLFKIDTDASIPDDAFDIIDQYYDEDKSPLIAQAPEASTIPAKGEGENSTIEEENSKEADTIESENAGSETEDEKSNWGIFLACLLAGILTLATPCVFPMIPMTVSFFTKQNKNVAKGKFNGVMYGLFIVLIYVACSLPFHLFQSVSPDIFNEFSTNPVLNLIFFIIFVIFAISFFGAFEITMPNSLINKVDKASNVGGLIGIFFMALTLVLVSFSCTGPVIGGVLGSVLSTDGGATALTFGMMGFGIGLGIPFALFAIFPSWMEKLPKSGGWLNTVKVFLGFLELAFAFKFLSNADLVLQLGYLTREVFIAIWIAVFAAMALYLFGKIKLPHDGLEQNISVGRLLVALCALFCTVYLIPGMWGAPLKIISGFPPPMTYAESIYGVGYSKTELREELPEGAHLAVHDIVAFHDYEEGLAFAKAENKPVLLDFTGWACVNCRKMEERVWGEPQVINLLKNDFVLISLYVDERKTLPKNEQYVSPKTDKKIRTVGNKWSDLQITKYNVNAQPYYAILNGDGKDLVKPVGYTPDPDEYAAWLQSGLDAYKK
ncbi:thiol:disulfide interchange protein [Nonlabens spongiae]|uniref:Thiol:disulfide interchange protein n=1 Tax=Nonlabens spongiae TaxID=331648 RepID=A0A1W6MHZ6_9FLAO|nr:thioredoxin family protein [Nonlabens spongiae]ARN77223.1 thiol:disulfide interchange protein [Nonlabens spongiae]